jgi:hypothetical protein
VKNENDIQANASHSNASLLDRQESMNISCFIVNGTDGTKLSLQLNEAPTFVEFNACHDSIQVDRNFSH